MALTLEDRIAVQDLLVRYGYAIDVGCTEEEFLDLFTEDAIMLSPLSGVHNGIDGVKKFRNRHVAMWGKIQIRHIITNFVIDGEGDRATLTAYFVEFKTQLELTPPQTERNTEFLYCGTYDCVARKINGKWKLERRTVSVDHR
jgi:hypothetical protein